MLKAFLKRIKNRLLRGELARLRIIEERLASKCDPFTAAQIDARIGELLAPVDANSRPTINALRMALRDLPNTKIALKAIANDLARQRLAEIRTVAPIGLPVIGLQSKASTQNDIESLWVAYWCKRLNREIHYHRKTWELSYVLQMIYENFSGSLSGKTGIGFGCGKEPLPSIFVSDDALVTITDAPPEISGAWSSTDQHTASIDMAFHEKLVDAKRFSENAQHAFCDMNKIPCDFDGKYDFVWSVCAYEHLGSIEHGVRFIDRCCDLLKPGGISVHTTEFNIDDGETPDNCMVVLFQKKHFLEMEKRAEAKGCRVAPIDFSVGTGVFDGYIDTPPFEWDPRGVPSVAYLKAGIDGFRSTCFGLAITKRK